MATAVETETLTVALASLKKKVYAQGRFPKRELRPEDRTDLTIEEAEALADGRSFELIDGWMVFKMLDRKHSKIQGFLIGKLFVYFEQNPIVQVLPEFSLRFWPKNKHQLRTPDIAVFLNENLHEEEKYETRAPDLVIEIVSGNSSTPS